MEILHKLKRKDYTQFVFISGEIVCIFPKEGQYNYSNTMVPEMWASGCYELNGNEVVLGIKPHGAVIEALKMMGYTVKV